MAIASSAARVYQVNIGTGGVPKLPVQEARVTRLGLEGDRVREVTLHGGPLRAICLYGIEAIERLQAEGHPTEPGGVGENLTTVGVEWSTLPGGTRVQVGDEVVLELTTPAMPCDTQRPNFRDGRFGRMSILTHPSDSRMYASVLREGVVRPGDPITLLPPEPDSVGERAGLMARIDRVEQQSNLRLWRAAIAGGLDVRVLDDGELSAAAAPLIPGSRVQHLQRSADAAAPGGADHGALRGNGVTGWLPMHEPPWLGAEPDFQLAITRRLPRRSTSNPSPKVSRSVCWTRARPPRGPRCSTTRTAWRSAPASRRSLRRTCWRRATSMRWPRSTGRVVRSASGHCMSTTGWVSSARAWSDPRRAVAASSGRSSRLGRCWRAKRAATCSCRWRRRARSPSGTCSRSASSRSLVRDVYRYEAARVVSDAESYRFERTGPGGAVVRVTLTRPEVHNAFNADAHRRAAARLPALGRRAGRATPRRRAAGDGP